MSLFERLREAITAGAVTLALDFAHLRKGGSPVLVEADLTIWILGPGAAAVAGWVGAERFAGIPGWMVALPIAAVGVVLFRTFARSYIERRIERRVHVDSFKDVAAWRKLWRFGGITLTRADGGPPATCAAPDGNWFEFARRLPQAKPPA